MLPCLGLSPGRTPCLARYVPRANAWFHGDEGLERLLPSWEVKEGDMNQKRRRILFVTLMMIAVTWFPFPIAV